MIQTLVIAHCDILDYIAHHGQLATREELNAKIGAIWRKYGECYLVSGGVIVALHDIGGGRVWAYVSDANGLLAYRVVDITP